MNDNTEPQTSSNSNSATLANSRISAVKVGSIFLSGIAINKFSDLFDSTAPFVIVASVLILFAVFAFESKSFGQSHEIAHSPAAREALDLVKFCLASLVLGAIIAAVWMLPIFERRQLQYPFSSLIDVEATQFFGFELGAATCITALSVLAAVRRNSAMQVFAFLTSAVAGMTLAVAAHPGAYDYNFSFTYTFIGWLIFASVFTVLVAIVPDVAGVYAGFWFKARKRGSGSATHGESEEPRPVARDRSATEPTRESEPAPPTMPLAPPPEGSSAETRYSALDSNAGSNRSGR